MKKAERDYRAETVASAKGGLVYAFSRCKDLTTKHTQRGQPPRVELNLAAIKATVAGAWAGSRGRGGAGPEGIDLPGPCASWAGWAQDGRRAG